MSDTEVIVLTIMVFFISTVFIMMAIWTDTDKSLSQIKKHLGMKDEEQE